MDSQFQITAEENLLNVNENTYSIHDHSFSHENPEGLMRTSSLTSLDFMIKGERMVSELCNITAEFLTNDTSKSNDISSRRGCTIERQFNTMTHNISRQHKASQTIDNSYQSGHRNLKYGFEIYDETIPLQIIHLAVEACTVAEDIAIANKYRPCFKNIQTICEKTRSNVQQPDSAVAQLHSQGVPWVMKNFIFAFVRILDGWKGIKELMCEKHESFARIEKKYYNPHIQQCFLEWQSVTKNMLDHIYRTFKSLDEGFKAEQQAIKKNNNYSLIQNQIKLQSKPQMKTSQYYEPPIQWNNAYGQNISHEIQMAAKWSTNMAIPNTLSSIKSSFVSGVHVDCNNAYRINSMSNIYENQKVLMENDPKVINGMGDSSKATFQQQSRNDLVSNKILSDVTNKAMCSSHFCATSSLNDKQMLQNNGIRMLSSNAPLSPGPDNILICNRDHKGPILGKSVNYQSYRSCQNESTIQSQISPINCFNTESFLNNNCSWPNNMYNCSVQMEGNNMESSCCLQSNCGTGAVYMKPGRYNVPIKMAENKSLLLGLEQSTVESMIILNSDIGAVQNMAKSAPESTMSSSQLSYFEQSNDNIQNVPSYNSKFKYSEIDQLCKIDEKWEAAKGSAPELINEMSISERPTVYEPYKKNRPVSNTNVIQTPYLLFSGEYCKNSNVVDDDNHIESNFEGYATSCENIKQLNALGKSQSIGKRDSIIEKDFANRDIAKKIKKKNKFLMVKQFGKKRDFDAIKRMENILNSVLTMEKSLGINTDVDISQASHYHSVIKNPITFDQVSGKIRNSSFYTIDLLENDIRKIYADAITHLEAYPESMLKSKIEKLSQYFEDIIVSDDLSDVGNSSKCNNNVYSVKSILKKSDLSPDKNISFARESKMMPN